MSLCVTCNEFYASAEGGKCSVCARAVVWTITLKDLEGHQADVRVAPSVTVLRLKELVMEKQWGFQSVDHIRVIFAGRQLTDTDTLTNARLRDGVTIHIVGALYGD